MSSLIIAAAGAGKTTFLVKKALEISENILITTYTDANEQSIRDKFYEINGCIPSNVTIMPWFSLLIKHGIRPYQSYLINNRVSGVLLVNKADKNLLRLKDTNEKKYVTASGNVYSNMISKLPCVLDELSNGCVFRRIRKIFSYVFVDEIQDFVGYDLEVIKKLHEVGCNMTLVGDPRQTTYRTHYEAKYKKYAGGKIVIFVQDNIAGMNIDTTTLSTSHRNNQIYGPVVRIPVISSEPQYLRTPAIQERRTGFRRFQHYGTRYRHLGSPSETLPRPYFRRLPDRL